MGLKKAENQVKHLLGDTIVALCRNTLSHAAEINVEGLIGITLDKEEIFLVNISQTIEIPEAAAKKQEKRQSHKRQSTADQDDQSLSDESSSEDSGDQTDDSSPRKKRRRRHRRKRRSNARAQDVIGQSTRSSHVSANAPEQTIANEGPVSNQSNLIPNISMDSSLPNVPPVIDVNPNVNQTLPQHAQGASSVDNQQGESSFTNITLQSNTGRPSSCSNDTDQNGVNVKDEVMSDDNDDEDLVIVKEEIGDNSYPNPVYIFPNVSQSLGQNESLLSPSFTNASMTSPTQSQPSAGPVPGPSNFAQSSVWHSQESTPIESKKRPNDPGSTRIDNDFQTNVQFKLDVLLGMVSDLQQSMIVNMGLPEQVTDVLDGPCTTVEELEEMLYRLQMDTIFKQRLVKSLVSIGGTNVKDCVKRMMRTLATYDVWAMYSLYGRKGKRNFKSLPLCQVLGQANLQVNKEAKLQEIEDVISDYLRQAPFRHVKRNRRPKAVPQLAVPFDLQEL